MSVMTGGRIVGYEDRDRDFVKVRWATEKGKIPIRYPR